ncbi:MAG: glycosyltransferase family 2 protein [Desulfobacteraceae bacterium]|nr:glycosyltransferase family 2 protein [Desulfobacteraceae bacterium]
MNVDIILPTYNRNEMLIEALHSVASQTYPHWVCWIAEDGSSSETRAVISPFLNDNRFHYLPGPHEGTPVVPRNRAYLAGNEPWVAFLDDDDIWLPQKLEKQIAFLNTHQDCVLLGSNALIMRENQEGSEDGLPPYFSKGPFGRVPYSTIVQDDWFINSSVIVRRSALLYSGFQNSALMQGEDYDLWLRVGVLGEMWLIRDTLVIYRDRSTQNAVWTKPSHERRQIVYHTKYKIYRSALSGVGEFPSPLLFPENAKQERACRRELDFYASGPKFLGRLRHHVGSKAVELFCLHPSKQQIKKSLEAFSECKARWKPLRRPYSVECIIFSKDRAIQLHALLSTFREKVVPAVPAHVLYHASSEAHDKSYDELTKIFSDQDIHFIRQTANLSFKNHLLNILLTQKCDLVFFLVDDILFTESVDLNEFLQYDPDQFVPSLRMGTNLSKCYMVQKFQPLPPFLETEVKGPDKIAWRWNSGTLDWTYPLSVDGHFFDRREIATMASLICFKAPNSFEDNLQIFRSRFLNRIGIGYKKSRIVNIPCNRVQEEISNRSGDTPPDQLLQKWCNGLQIDYTQLYGYINNGVHEEIPLIFKKRDPAKTAKE